MLWFKWRLSRWVSVIFLSALPVLAACGFEPVWSENGSARALFRQIATPEPRDVDEFRLIARVEDKLGRGPENAPYKLSIALETEKEAQTISAAQEQTGFTLTGKLRWQLLGADGSEQSRGEILRFTSYSATSTTAATLAAEKDARERLMIILADQLVDQLILLSPTAQ